MERAELVAEIEKFDEHHVVTLSGELDLLGAPRLSVLLGEVARAGTGGLVVDLSDLEFIDSTGIASLLNALRRLTRQGRRMATVVKPGAVFRALEIARLLDDLRASASLREALAKVDGPG
jgi:anti-sigma B factor antagonist